jgi:hypothetical protein
LLRVGQVSYDFFEQENMVNLLFVTDNLFFSYSGEIYDDLCFERGFFDDYFSAFECVRVAARVKPITAILPDLHRADGKGLSFYPLSPVSGLSWNLAPRHVYLKPLEAAVGWADAVCVRIPAVAAWHAFRMARRQSKPVMFEMAGDPLTYLAGNGQWVDTVMRRAQAYLLDFYAHDVIRGSQVGSYVSRSHLQLRFPPPS